MAIVTAEWRKKRTHRDIRITILNTAINLLKKEKYAAQAWQILDAAATDATAEVLISILGAANG